MFKLRPYQQGAVQSFLDDMRSSTPSKGIAVLPTGTGKSFIIAGVAAEYSGPVLALQPSKELLEQNYAKFLLTGSTAAICSASFNKKEIGHVTFATIGTAIKFIEEFKSMKGLLVICDEAHYKYSPDRGSQFRNFIDKVKPKFLYGLTATPFRLHNSRGGSMLKMINRTSPRVFSKILYVQQISEAIDLGFWAKSVDRAWYYDDSNLELNSSGTDYTDRSIREANNANSVNRNIAIEVLRQLKEGNRKSILVFTDSVESAREFSEFFSKRTSCGYVHGGTSKKERKFLVDGFKNGDIKLLFNYGVFTTGFDHPALDSIIMGRPTNSLSQFYQIYGRGVRTSPGKEDFLFLDACDNFGRLCHPRDIVVEDHHIVGWSIFGGDKLLTNTTLGGSNITRDDLEKRLENQIEGLDQEKMPFGKWKNRKIVDMCKWDRGYAQFILPTLNTETYGPRLKNLIEAALKQQELKQIIG